MTPDEIKDLIILQRQMEWEFRLEQYTDSSLGVLQKSVTQAKKEAVDYIKKRGNQIGETVLQQQLDVIDEMNKLTLGIQGRLTTRPMV